MKKILIIEDNLDVRENLAEILILSGYEALLAENGKIGGQKTAEKLKSVQANALASNGDFATGAHGFVGRRDKLARCLIS